MLLRLMRSNPRFSAFLTPTFCRQESFQLGLLMDSKDEEEKKYGQALCLFLIRFNQGLKIATCTGDTESMYEVTKKNT